MTRIGKSMTYYEGKITADELVEILGQSDPETSVRITFQSPGSALQYSNEDREGRYFEEYAEQPSPPEAADIIREVYEEGISGHTLCEPILNADVRPAHRIGGVPEDDSLAAGYRVSIKMAPENAANDNGAGLMTAAYTLDWVDPVDGEAAAEKYLTGFGLEEVEPR